MIPGDKSGVEIDGDLADDQPARRSRAGRARVAGEWCLTADPWTRGSRFPSREPGRIKKGAGLAASPIGGTRGSWRFRLAVARDWRSARPEVEASPAARGEKVPRSRGYGRTGAGLGGRAKHDNETRENGPPWVEAVVSGGGAEAERGREGDTAALGMPSCEGAELGENRALPEDRARGIEDRPGQRVRAGRRPDIGGEARSGGARPRRTGRDAATDGPPQRRGDRLFGSRGEGSSGDMAGCRTSSKTSGRGGTRDAGAATRLRRRRRGPDRRRGPSHSLCLIGFGATQSGGLGRPLVKRRDLIDPERAARRRERGARTGPAIRPHRHGYGDGAASARRATSTGRTRGPRAAGSSPGETSRLATWAEPHRGSRARAQCAMGRRYRGRVSARR